MDDGEPHPAAGPPRPGRHPRLRRTGWRPGPSSSTWGLVLRLWSSWEWPGSLEHLPSIYRVSTVCQALSGDRAVNTTNIPSPPRADILVKGTA